MDSCLSLLLESGSVLVSYGWAPGGVCWRGSRDLRLAVGLHVCLLWIRTSRELPRCGGCASGWGDGQYGCFGGMGLVWSPGLFLDCRGINYRISVDLINRTGNR